MDEGWSDAFELFVTLRDEEGPGDSFPSGEWAFNQPNGVREVPVSSNTTVNKLPYANARSRRQLYRIGNVWTTMINEVLWNMVDKAMLDAEKLLFDGTYACAIHAGFAKRGLGAKATQEK
ncbi:Fungalysin metallopeptidase-domain-containing protein [Cladochytrium replicatum]|nr:Fungalysin metallopeptidase-domain-containing protein [Cladochytrium replicatum]